MNGRNSARTARFGFTLMELLIVIGIIVLLIGILLPVVSHVRRQSLLTSQKMDFQAITQALTAYHQDFNDYPRSSTFASIPLVTTALNYDFPLAAALIGPGPGVTQTMSVPTYSPLAAAPATAIVAGDGKFGLGFRTQVQAIPVSVASSAGQLQITAVSNDSLLPSYIAGDSCWSVDLMPGTTTEQIVGLTTPTGYQVGPPFQFSATATSTVTGSGPWTGNLLITTGKVWSNYLSPDTFKIQYAPVAVDNSGNPILYQPILLDRWGNPIQYFVRNGANNNRTGDSTDFSALSAAARSSIQFGPLIGYSAPMSIDSTNGENAIWDMRYGIPVMFQVKADQFLANWSGQRVANNNFQALSNPLAAPGLALRWMLGDDPDPAGSFPYSDNAIKSPETLHYTGEFVLISAGPDGAFCNFQYDPATGQPVLPQKYQAFFTASGNVYNFDR